jgi:hypothetical protein
LSFRKDALIVLLIVILCTILVMQLFPTEPLGTDAGTFQPVPAEEGAETRADDPRPDIRFTMDVHLPEDAYRALSNRLSQTARAFPHVSVDVANFAPDEARNRLLEAAEAGELADIVMLDLAWVGEFAAKGYLSRWPNGPGRTSEDPVQRLTGWNGYRWIAAYETDPYVVAYSGHMEIAAPGETLPRTLEEWAGLRARRGEKRVADGLIYADLEDPGAFISLVSAMGGSWQRADDGRIVPGEDGAEILGLLFGRTEAGDGGRPPLYPLAVMEKLEKEEMWRRFSDGTLPFIVVPLSELSARGLANRQLSGLTEAGAAGTFWIRGTGLAVSSASAAAEEAFDWLETLVAGRDSGTARAWQLHMLDAFGGDPELPAKLDALRSAAALLLSGETDAAGFAESLAEQRPAP